MEAFSKFGSDLDAATKAVLDKGKRNVEVLKQSQYSPVSVEKQVAIIYLGTNNLLKDVPVEKVKDFENVILTELEQRHPSILDNFRKGLMNDEDIKTLRGIATEMSSQYRNA